MARAHTDAAAYTVQRPHRADAARNFDALLLAARSAFAQHGSQAALEDIARDAGVGIGTLYRNFPTRHHLFNAIYMGEVEQLCTLAAEIADLPPWQALEVWIHRFVSFDVTKRAIAEGLDRDSDMFHAGSEALRTAGKPLLSRAQEAGDARTDTSFDDVMRMVVGLTASVFVDEAQRERVLAMALDGVRADGTKPRSVSANVPAVRSRRNAARSTARA
jgi:AcrR family transcriptional regulator